MTTVTDASPGIDPELAAEMAGFDALPAEARRRLASAPLPVPTEVIATLLRIGLPPALAVPKAVELIELYGTEQVVEMARNTE